MRAHSEGEPVGVRAFFEGGEYLYRLVKWLLLPTAMHSHRHGQSQ